MCEAETTCLLNPTFWVQSIPTSHNLLTCANHLTRTIREIDEKSRIPIDPKAPLYARTYGDLHGRGDNAKVNQTIVKPENWIGSPINNYARVTVKVYTKNG